MNQAERTILLLHQLTKGAQNLVERLAPAQAVIELGADVAKEPQAQLLFSFAVNLSARLYPVVQRLQIVLPALVRCTVRFPRWHADDLDEHVRLLLESLKPPIKWEVRNDSSDEGHRIVVGSHPSRSGASIFAGSEGWIASVSPNGPVTIAGPANPVGPYAAACLAVGELWKRMLLPHQDLFTGVPIIPLDAPLSFSTFTYEADQPDSPNPLLPELIDLGRVTTIGLGAGGGAAAYTLATLPALAGTMAIVEPDAIEDGNLNRYIFADAEDAYAQRSKVAVIEDLLSRHSNLMVRPFPTPFREAADSLGPEDYQQVLAAVHSRAARRDLQYETPQLLLDAAASPDGEFRVWRMQLGVTECMWCKHPPGENDPEEQKAEQLTRLLGLTPGAWLRKVRDNESFSAEEVSAIATKVGAAEQPFRLPSVGERYGAWEASQCGKLPLAGGNEEVPVPFAPVMAGVLVAGELIKQASFPEAVRRFCYWNTLMGKFMRRNRPYIRPPNPTCRFCHDPVYLEQYRKRWQSGLQADHQRSQTNNTGGKYGTS